MRNHRDRHDGGSKGGQVDFRRLFARLVTEGNIDPESAWNLEVPDALTLIDCWTYHPTLRYMLSKFIGYAEEGW